MSNLYTSDLTNLIETVKDTVTKSKKKHSSQFKELDDRRSEIQLIEAKTRRFGGQRAIKKFEENNKAVQLELDSLDSEIQKSILKDIKKVFNEDILTSPDMAYQLFCYINTSDDKLKDFVNSFALNYMSLNPSNLKGSSALVNKLNLQVMLPDGSIRQRTTTQPQYITDRQVFQILSTSPSKILPQGIGDNYVLFSSSNIVEIPEKKGNATIIKSRLKSLAGKNNEPSRVAQKLTLGCLTNYKIMGDFAASKIISKDVNSMYSNAEIVENIASNILEIDYRGFPKQGVRGYKTDAIKYMNDLKKIAAMYKKTKLPIADEHQKMLSSGIFVDHLFGYEKVPQEAQLLTNDLYEIDKGVLGHETFYEAFRHQRDMNKYKQVNLHKVAPVIERIWMKGFEAATQFRD